MYKMVLAGALGFVAGACVATFVCYTMWYKNQKALVEELGDTYNRIDDLDEKLANTEKYAISQSEMRTMWEQKADEYREALERNSEYHDRVDYTQCTPDDGEGALCELDGPDDEPVNHCPNPRFVICQDNDLADYWRGIYTEFEVRHYADGAMVWYNGGFEQRFFPEQAGGRGNIVACLATRNKLILDNVRGVLFHFVCISEEEEEPDFYENSFEDYEEY